MDPSGFMILLSLRDEREEAQCPLLAFIRVVACRSPGGCDRASPPVGDRIEVAGSEVAEERDFGLSFEPRAEEAGGAVGATSNSIASALSRWSGGASSSRPSGVSGERRGRPRPGVHPWGRQPVNPDGWSGMFGRVVAETGLLHAGVDTSVIALWLGHETIKSTHLYLHADFRLKEQALARTAPNRAARARFKPDHEPLAFLEHL